MGGSGKSTLCKKIQAYVRSQGHIVLGCAATALAATVYDDFYTAHALFKFPVEDDTDDPNPNVECKLIAFPERLELLQSALVIIWDEWCSNHKNIFEAAYRALDGFKGKILICSSDLRQIGPVIQHGEKHDIIQASMLSSPLWQEFIKFRLTVNLRLRSKNQTASSIQRQRHYNDLILAIGEGKTDCPQAIVTQPENSLGVMSYKIPNLNHFNIKSSSEAVDFVFPENLSESKFAKRAILAGI
jgi:hypothetical protein